MENQNKQEVKNNSIVSEFVPYEESLELKELGFDEPCFGLYAPPSKTVFLHHYGLLTAKEQVLAPLYQQAFRWFREKYSLIHNIDRDGGYWITSITNFSREEYDTPKTSYIHPSEYEGEEYEDAQLACLRKLIEIVKKK